jgi:hypothetical protein
MITNKLLPVLLFSGLAMAGSLAAQAGPPPAQEAASAPVEAASIAQLAADDQSDRKREPPLSVAQMQANDAARRDKALGLLRGGALRSGEDWHDAALIFQHGETDADARLAFALATIAAQLEPESRGAAWLGAAAWDRLLMRRHRPQWYGTQYVPSEDGKSWVLYEFDPGGVTDTERAAAGVEAAADIERSFPRQVRPGR